MKLAFYVTPYGIDFHDLDAPQLSLRGHISSGQIADGPTSIAMALRDVLHQCGIASTIEYSRSMQPSGSTR